MKEQIFSDGFFPCLFFLDTLSEKNTRSALLAWVLSWGLPPFFSLYPIRMCAVNNVVFLFYKLIEDIRLHGIGIDSVKHSK